MLEAVLATIQAEFSDLDVVGVTRVALRMTVALLLGAVIGWGRSLGGPPPGPSSWHRIDIESPATEQALPLLRLSLAGLAAPAGSELHYSQAGQALQEDWSGLAWAPPRPSTGHGLGRRRAR